VLIDGYCTYKVRSISKQFKGRHEMKMSERDLELCKLKEEGYSVARLAAKYEISRSRVYQIYERYLEYKHEEKSAPPLKKLLTARMRNALINYFVDDSIFADPARIMSCSLSDYKKVQNIGKEALDSLVNGMLALGYVKKGNKWLKS